ncbi:NifB/NifX family molybdenum-iron cluster-binding protein [Marinospirillum alkaliphilum]|uniref:Dinitrogenase iron-molybdenum cofactor n=1 Tax=Marinospirillum alkaliphilum DSM 21637 TaxID=1122209 RepID=A0A1K1TCD3_9GAMM|nr:hypothetical protein [Marinospirillum alkaliphilum]SFW98084.1 Dinitrogenase iron-molybdenum cofactor [Marinospirillum alkaliphilum DSM 21637]
MRIAAASRDGVTLAGHLGKCDRWIVYEVTSDVDGEPTLQEVERVHLPKALVFHHFRDDCPHPLGDCVAVLGASAGDNFIRKMQQRGMTALLTAETDPRQAVLDYCRNNLPPPKPRPIGSLICKVHDLLSSDK